MKAWVVKDLARSGITEEAAEACGIGRQENDEWYKIPYFNEDNTPLRVNGKQFYRKRLRNPPPGKGKYIQPAGAGTQLYYPPVDPDEVQNTGELLIVEGEKKALAAALAGYRAVGMGGKDNWVKAGNKPVVKGLRCYVCIDSEVAYRGDVMASETRLANDLLRLGAEVYICRIPFKRTSGEMGPVTEEEKDKANDRTKERGISRGKMFREETFVNVGLDDYIVAGGSMEELLRKARPYRYIIQPSSDLRTMEAARMYALVNRGGKVFAYMLDDEGYVDQERRLSLRDALNTWKTRYFTIPGPEGKPKAITALAYYVGSPSRGKEYVEKFVPTTEAEDEKINPWRGLAVRPVRDDAMVARVRRELRAMFCSSDSFGCKHGTDIVETVYSSPKARERALLGFMRKAIVNPHTGAPKVVLNIVGDKGTGKTTFGNFFSGFFRQENVYLNSPKTEAASRFSTDEHAVLEWRDEGDRPESVVLRERGKNRTTAKHIAVERKGVDTVLVENFHHELSTSNNLGSSASTADDHRNITLEASSYLAEMEDARREKVVKMFESNKARSAVLYYLMHQYVEEFGEWNPRRRPFTAALAASQTEVSDPLLAVVRAAVARQDNRTERDIQTAKEFMREHGTSTQLKGTEKPTARGRKVEEEMPGWPRPVGPMSEVMAGLIEIEANITGRRSGTAKGRYSFGARFKRSFPTLVEDLGHGKYRLASYATFVLVLREHLAKESMFSYDLTGEKE